MRNYKPNNARKIKTNAWYVEPGIDKWSHEKNSLQKKEADFIHTVIIRVTRELQKISQFQSVSYHILYSVALFQTLPDRCAMVHNNDAPSGDKFPLQQNNQLYHWDVFMG